MDTGQGDAEPETTDSAGKGSAGKDSEGIVQKGTDPDDTKIIEADILKYGTGNSMDNYSAVAVFLD